MPREALRHYNFRPAPGGRQHLTGLGHFSHIELYMEILGLKFEAGRATIAQQLHYLREGKSQSVGVHVGVDLVHSVSLGNKSGGGSDSSRGRSKTNPADHSEFQSVKISREANKTTLDRLHIDNYHNRRQQESNQPGAEADKVKYREGRRREQEDKRRKERRRCEKGKKG